MKNLNMEKKFKIHMLTYDPEWKDKGDGMTIAESLDHVSAIA